MIFNEKQELALELQVSLSKNNLFEYSKLMWPVVEPGVQFKPGWHIQAICEHLQAVTNGEIQRLLINMPPRHMKSLAISVFWPSWVWLKHPESRWLFASYAESLSTRDSLKCRDVIRSKRYQNFYWPEWALKDDQDQKKRFNNTKQGYRIATSVGGSGTGEGGDYIVADDPHNAIDIRSEPIRQSVIDWWFQTMSTRGNDPAKAKYVVVMQRLHEKDLSGEILSRGGYEHLMLPAEFEPKRMSYTKIGWRDPRTKEGELLWPTHFGETQIQDQKRNLGSSGYAGQFQQSPMPAEGGLFKRKWWRFFKEKPMNIIRIVQFWDCASKPGISNDYSVCLTVGETPSGYYFLDLWRNKVEMPDLEAACKAQYHKWSPTEVVIEDKSAGIGLIQSMRRTTKMPIKEFLPTKDKEVRASHATPTVESGNCYLQDGSVWLDDFLNELERFPNGEHDDQVDVVSMAVEYFKQPKRIEPRVRTL